MYKLCLQPLGYIATNTAFYSRATGINMWLKGLQIKYWWCTKINYLLCMY